MSAWWLDSLDQMYHQLKTNGTPQQMQFLDDHLQSRQQALQLGDELGSLLSSISGNTQEDQLRTALALIKVKLAPVVVMSHRFSGDNHGDSLLQTETAETLEALDALALYWQLVQEYGLADSMLYATINVFGRTPRRNRDGGRNHAGYATNGFIHGTHLKGGMVGGLESRRNDDVQATSINSNTGGIENPDIASEATLASFAKTIMAASGVTESRVNRRVPDGKIVSSIF